MTFALNFIVHAEKHGSLLLMSELQNRFVLFVLQLVRRFNFKRDLADFCLQLGILKRKSLLEDLDGGFTKIGMHDLWREFAVAETISKDFRDRHWVYQVDARSAVQRSGRWRENVQRMGFVNEGWKGLRGLNLDGFVNMEAFKLQVDRWMEDCELELDLRGWKHLKSLHVGTTPELTLMFNGLSSLSSLGLLTWWGTLGLSPCIAEIRCLTNLQVLELACCSDVQVVDVLAKAGCVGGERTDS